MTFSEFKEIYKSLETDDEKNKFINDRISLLVKEAIASPIGTEICGSYGNFIGPLTELSSNSIFPNMKFDDMDIYKEFLEYIENDIDKYLSKEPVTIICIQQFVWKYFGANAGNIFERMNAYDTKDWNSLSIKELKGKNIAACSERSALVQNLLIFMGFKSEIIFGKLNKSESHSYIIFTPEKSNEFKILYDPMNPVVYTEHEKEEYAIGVSKIYNDEYERLKNGGSYKFDYNMVKRIYGQDNKYYEDERFYTCDDYLYNGREKLL